MTAQRFGLETVREALRRRVEETTLRDVADEIPMSFSGLRSFLKGGTPQPATRAKLVAWYASRRGKRLSKADVDAAIDLLSEFISEAGAGPARARRLRQIVERLGGS
jgi:hypothetical protein